MYVPASFTADKAAFKQDGRHFISFCMSSADVEIGVPVRRISQVFGGIGPFCVEIVGARTEHGEDVGWDGD